MNLSINKSDGKSLKLNPRQRSLIVGLMLGNGVLESEDKGRTYRLKVEYPIQKREYVDWIYWQLKNLVPQKPQIEVKQSGGKSFQSYYFRTYSLGSLRFYAHQFFRTGKKVIPKLLKKLLDPVAMAVWFMDRGTLKSNRYPTYIIDTIGYSKKELIAVKKIFQDKFGILIGMHKRYGKFCIYIYSDYAKKFKNLIEPYIISSMKYKLG